jgi:hypothetical protein
MPENRSIGQLQKFSIGSAKMQKLHTFLRVLTAQTLKMNDLSGLLIGESLKKLSAYVMEQTFFKVFCYN